MLGQLLLIALATFASEDLTLAATGVLVAQDRLTFAQGAAACIAGIFAGDMLIYLGARIFGANLLGWRWVARCLPAERVNRGAEWLNKRGLGVVFLSRFTPGLRLPTYFAAGLLPTRTSQFAGYFLLAALVWTPLFLLVTGRLSDTLLARWFAGRGASFPAFAAVFAAVVAGAWLVRALLNPARWRKYRWEFWPSWAAYLPLLPYLIYLGVRHRSLTLFTAANPGIAAGGLVGESKSEILRGLGDGPVADFEFIAAGLGIEERAARGLAFASRFGWPVVMKPDVGERGAGVAVLRSAGELRTYLEGAGSVDTIAQRYVGGVEFGLFYYRLPDEPTGRIFSVTEKRFPVLAGDGRSTLRQLILADERAACMAETYFRLTRHPLAAVPAAGENVQVVEIGSHCRGAIFLDGRYLVTPKLSAAVDRISQAFPEFYVGRYDVRAESEEALRAGRFTILELNGVSAEPAHIYDPQVSLREAYRAMCTQWRVAFEAGARNRERGFAPMSVGGLIRVFLAHR